MHVKTSNMSMGSPSRGCRYSDHPIPQRVLPPDRINVVSCVIIPAVDPQDAFHLVSTNEIRLVFFSASVEALKILSYVRMVKFFKDGNFPINPV